MIYTGVTNDLLGRTQEHRDRTKGSFTSKYNVWKLVYYEVVGDSGSAIEREKQIKAGPRRNKVELVRRSNPTWRDLWSKILGEAEH